VIRGPQTAGLLTGLALAAGLVFSARPVAGPPLGLDLRIAAIPSGEVGVAAPGPILTARTLRPGGRATGTVVLRNHTPVRLAVRAAVQGSSDADRHLRVRVRARGTILYDGTLAGLRAHGGRPLVLAKGRAAALALDAWVPAGAAETALAGREAHLTFTFGGEPVR
jgi:hypothetical protein